VRGMMVTDEDRELLPPWAGFAGCVLESDELVPTASRESLQRNDAYQRATRQITDSLITGLADIARHQPESWQRMLARHNEALLGAALCDMRLFDLLARDVTVPTSQGDLPVPAVLERSDGKLHVSQDEDGGFEALLFRALKVPVVRGTRYAALPFCRMYTEQRAGQLVVLGTGTGDRQLFRPASLPAADSERLISWFAPEDDGPYRDVAVVLAHFEPVHLPLVWVPDREVALKRRIESDEARRSIATAALRLAREFTGSIDDGPAAHLYINVDCPAISALLRAPADKRRLGVELLRALVGFTAPVDGAGAALDPDAALRQFSASVAALLGDEATA
ncbi:MAG: molecular chaperone HtpG, partial [Myxococcota bacterium]